MMSLLILRYLIYDTDLIKFFGTQKLQFFGTQKLQFSDSQNFY